MFFFLSLPAIDGPLVLAMRINEALLVFFFTVIGGCLAAAALSSFLMGHFHSTGSALVGGFAAIAFWVLLIAVKSG